MKIFLFTIVLLAMVWNVVATRAGEGINMEVVGSQPCTDAQNAAKTRTAKACEPNPALLHISLTRQYFCVVSPFANAACLLPCLRLAALDCSTAHCSNMAKSSAEETKCIAEHCAKETADSKQATCACGVSHDDTDKDNREACGIYTSLNSEFASINHSGAATLQGSMLSALVAVAVAAKLSSWA